MKLRNLSLVKNTKSGGEEDTGESGKSISPSRIGRGEKRYEWTVWILDLRKLEVQADFESILRTYGGCCWVLVNDLKKQIYIIPREFECAGRKLRIELE